VNLITRIPFLGKLTNRLLFKDDEIFYIPINELIEPGANVALPSDIIRHFVKIAGQRWIMNECICRAAKGCRNHPIELGCIFLGEAVYQYHEPVERHVVDTEAWFSYTPPQKGMLSSIS
jgi:hypothetical protein